MNNPRPFLLTALVSLLAGCATAPPPAPDTRAADAKAIRDTEAAWLKEFAVKDFEKLVAHYADDASLLMPNMAAMNGKEAIRAAYKEMLADPNLAVTFEASRVEVSKASDYAYSQGAYAMTTSAPKTKRPMTEKGKFVTVYQKQADGSWKAVADILNADAPAVPAK